MIDIKKSDKTSLLKKINKTINLATGDHKNIPGPVHLNIRFDEPLYDNNKKLIHINPDNNITLKKNINLNLPNID